MIHPAVFAPPGYFDAREPSLAKRLFSPIKYKQYIDEKADVVYYYADHPRFMELSDKSKFELSDVVLDKTGVIKCRQGLTNLLDEYFGIKHE